MPCHATATGQESEASVEKKGNPVNTIVNASGNFMQMRTGTYIHIYVVSDKGHVD
jgi:hypothetical protein